MARTKTITMLACFMLLATGVANAKGKRAPNIFIKEQE